MPRANAKEFFPEIFKARSHPASSTSDFYKVLSEQGGGRPLKRDASDCQDEPDRFKLLRARPYKAKK